MNIGGGNHGTPVQRQIRALLLALLLAIPLATPPAQAQSQPPPLQVFRSVASWTVYYEPRFGACSVMRRINELRLVIGRRDHDGASTPYLMAFNAQWRWIEDGGRVPVVLHLAPAPERRASMTGANRGAYVGVLWFDADGELLGDLMRAGQIKLELSGQGGSAIIAAALNGLRAALLAREECDQAMAGR